PDNSDEIRSIIIGRLAHELDRPYRKEAQYEVWEYTIQDVTYEAFCIVNYSNRRRQLCHFKKASYVAPCQV
ncbi:MAG: hypothetical protein LBN33_08855, partial [Desulfovibrio sp.]|nr:hypothetical protein [Desulfovibrio sp.]